MMKRVPILFFLLLFFTGCSEFYQEGDFFYITREGASMPVWIRGNTDSGVFIITNHGGPGGTSMYLSRFHSFQVLEESHALVYWDQRNSGTSQGNPETGSLTPESFAQDLKLITDTVQMLYEPTHTFLHGISWGGTLALLYAAETGNQENLGGLIIEDGGHNMPLLMSASIQRVSDFGQEQIDAGKDEAYWGEALAFFSNHPNPETWNENDFLQYSSFLTRTNRDRAYPVHPVEGDFQGPGFEDIFLSPLSLSVFFNPSALLPHMNILSLDLTDEMEDISLPVLLLWGEYDFNSPVPEMPEDAAAALPNEIYEGPIPDAGHNPFVDNPTEYLRRFTEFIAAQTGGE